MTRSALYATPREALKERAKSVSGTPVRRVEDQACAARVGVREAGPDGRHDASYDLSCSRQMQVQQAASSLGAL